MSMATRTLYRPVGSTELVAIQRSGNQRFPRGSSGSRTSSPCAPAPTPSASPVKRRLRQPGYVTRFEVRQDFLARYAVHVIDARVHEEYRIPAEDLEAFNDAIVGPIEVVSEYPAQAPCNAGQH